MNVGPEAISELVREYPNSHVFFGQHQSGANFAVALQRPGWLVMELDHCWLMLEAHGDAWELHWFCPRGARLPALRAMLKAVFEVTKAQNVYGTQTQTHAYRREAKTLARALGAVRDGNRLILPRDRFLTYNAGKPGM